MLRIVIAFIIVLSLETMLLSHSLGYTIAGQNTNNPIRNDVMPLIDSNGSIKNVKIVDNNTLRTRLSSPEFALLDNQSGKALYGLTSYWGDPFADCDRSKCTAKSRAGLNGSASLQISTNQSSKHAWSSIKGKGIDVTPGQSYQLTSHLKLNEFATQSHVSIEEYNQTSKKWHQLMQCPVGTNGPLEWKEYNCKLIIPANTDKIRPVLYAGWSSQQGQEAVTSFGTIYLTNWEIAPTISDPNLKAELVYKGTQVPTTMAFLGSNDFLVLEKNSGNVYRITNGIRSEEPLLNVAVFHNDGLKGITVSKNTSHIPPVTYVFLYFTQSSGGKNNTPKCNCLYRYELLNGKLVNPKLILQLPTGQGQILHDGGIVKIGPDMNVYVIVGSINSTLSKSRNKALNFAYSPEPDGRAGILRTTQDGKPVGIGIIGDKFPLNLYYAYGIRNSFGIAFDPVTGKLWETENGPAFGDEINLVEPGFNSGWGRMMGIWQVNVRESTNFKNTTIPSTLVDFGGKGKYHPPEFTWNHTVAPTAMTFLNSDKLGKKYENDMFVADSNNGNIYHFKLNHDRTGLVLSGPLADKVVNNPEELRGITFATGFGSITDLEVGPDGYLYVVSNNQGKIYRIVPSGTS